MSRPTIILYGKPGCHLCEDARATLVEVRGEHPFELREVDVSIDPALQRAYGERVPVVELEGEELFEYHVDPEALRKRLDTVTS